MSNPTARSTELLYQDSTRGSKCLDITSPISLHEVAQLILDPIVFYTNKNIIDSIEPYIRELISSLHKTRKQTLVQ